MTPNFHTQTNIYPSAVNVPIACGGVSVLPGDLIVADDDGAVVVPIQLAPELPQSRGTRGMGRFNRLRLSEGGDLRTYYPLSDAARAEYEAWRRDQLSKDLDSLRLARVDRLAQAANVADRVQASE